MAADSEDKVSVVTGAVGNIGTAISTELARRGGTVVMVMRNVEKAQAVRDDVVRATGNERVELLACDRSSLDSVRLAPAS